MRTFRTHKNIRTQTLIEANKFPSVKLWPNPIGLATMGKQVAKISGKSTVKLNLDPRKTYTVIENPRIVKYGLAKGTSDTIGFKVETISGIKIPRFLAIEIKTQRDKPRKIQQKFLEMVQKNGGIAGVVREPADLLSVLQQSLLSADKCKKL